MEEVKNEILKQYEQGNIVLATPFGLQGTILEHFIKQPVDGMLYDLNRCEAVVLTFIPDQKWVNDYAVCKVIRALKSKIDELEKPNDVSTGFAEWCLDNVLVQDGGYYQNCQLTTVEKLLEIYKTTL